MTWEQFNPFSSSVQTLIIPTLGTNLLVHTQHKERTVTAIKLKKTKENNYSNNMDFNRNSTPLEHLPGLGQVYGPSVMFSI